MALLVAMSLPAGTKPVDFQTQVVKAHNTTRAALVSSNIHRDAGENTIGFATLSGATDSGGPNDTAMIAAANELLVKILAHYDDVDTVEYPASPGTFGVAHKAAWARATVAALSAATTVSVAESNLHTMAVDWNSHMLSSSAHDNADAGTTAVVQTTCDTYAHSQTCANQLKTAFNAHTALALAGSSLRRVPL